MLSIIIMQSTLFRRQFINESQKIIRVCMYAYHHVGISCLCRISPLNPAFVEWQKEQAEKNSSEVPNVSASEVKSASESEHTKGYIPGPVNLQHLSLNPPKVSDSANIPLFMTS